jgi:hypothetical protein
MTFSQREKVTLQHPRFARALQWRLRGAITRAIVGQQGQVFCAELHVIGRNPDDRVELAGT